MKHETVETWLARCYPGYENAVTVSAREKQVEYQLVADQPDLRATVPTYSYKRYGYALSHLVAQKMASSLGALALGFAARLTNSGMSALAVIKETLSFSTERPIVLGNVLYGETPKLFARTQATLLFVESADLCAIKEVTAESPALYIFETVGNGPGMPVLDLPAVFRILWQEESTLVLDNTLLSAAIFNPFVLYQQLMQELGRPKLRFVYVESLSKFYRATDRDEVTAGILIAPDEFISECDETLKLGYYLQYACLARLPMDLLAAAQERVKLLSKTAKVLSQSLETHPNVVQVWYPDTELQRIYNCSGGVLLFLIVRDDCATQILGRIKVTLGEFKGSFGHTQTTYLPLGQLLPGKYPVGLIRLAVGTETTDSELVEQFTRILA